MVLITIHTDCAASSTPGDCRAAMLLFLLCFLLSCAPVPAAAQPVGNPPTAAPAPADAPNAGVGTPSNATELSALLALRAQWQDPHGYLANWSASLGLPVCSWWGVTCTNSSVTSLYLSTLSLSGSLSPAIANLSSLSILNLANNKLSGRIPAELGSLPSLSRLQLAHNSFNGSIPDALFLSPSLQFLLLDSNNLSGEVPSTIANLVHLRYLSLASNSFTGPLPPSIANLTKLSAIYAGFNAFNGTIPLQIGDLNRLTFLDLQNNLLTGPMPSSIGSLTHLNTLLLNHNQLVGSLPPELGQLHDLIAMALSYNSFNGTIPEEIGDLSSLQMLDLCENSLEGIIPASLGNLTMLKALNLSYNNLSGEVPMNGILGSFNATSFLGNEFLCGGPLLDFQCYYMPQGGTSSMPPPRDYMNHRGPYPEEESELGKTGKITIAVVVGVVGLVVILVFIAFCSCRGRQEEQVERMPNSFSLDVQDSMRKAKLEIYMQEFSHSYEEIVSRAGYYDTAHVIGKGRFATVYKSELPGGRHLAVKVFNNPITRSTFEREMAHLHEAAGHVSTLLPIRGYYSNPIEKAIFYDFVPGGTLQDVLQNAPTLLDWSKRVNIALGIAQALAHLHKGSHIRTLHKDLKSSNVLLDDTFTPLLSDYGLLELVSKALVLTPGYTPPEFTSTSSSTKRYTEKTDIYNFGVVVLELLTGKSPTFHIEPNIEVHLVTWVVGLQDEGKEVSLLDAYVVESCPSIDHPIQALKLAKNCLNDEPAQRPIVYEIISILERLNNKSSPMMDTPHQLKKPLLK